MEIKKGLVIRHLKSRISKMSTDRIKRSYLNAKEDAETGKKGSNIIMQLFEDALIERKEIEWIHQHRL